jgi:hypothetical protein
MKAGARGLLRKLLLVVSLAAFLAGLEGRVIFHAFGQYIRLPPPLSYVAVTVALYGAAILVLLYLGGRRAFARGAAARAAEPRSYSVHPIRRAFSMGRPRNAAAGCACRDVPAAGNRARFEGAVT